MRIKGILFDKDGTLFDFRATWDGWVGDLLTELAAGNAGLLESLAASVAYDFETRSLRPGSIFVAGTNAEPVDRLLMHLPNWTARDLVLFMAELGGKVVPTPAVPLPPYLVGLQEKGFRCAVVTNDGEAPARQQLAQAGVEELFNTVIGFDSGFIPKPKPDTCLAAAGRLGLAPEACVMVGDSTHDLHAGRAAGMLTAAVLTGVAGADELRPHADIVLPDIGHLPGWLDAQNSLP